MPGSLERGIRPVSMEAPVSPGLAGTQHLKTLLILADAFVPAPQDPHKAFKAKIRTDALQVIHQYTAVPHPEGHELAVLGRRAIDVS